MVGHPRSLGPVTVTEDTRFRDFDAAEAERDGAPLSFALAGREWNATAPNAYVIVKFAKEAAAQGLTIAFYDLLFAYLDPADREPFEAAIQEHNVPMRTVINVVTWLGEQVNGDPFGEPSVSPRPSPPGGGQRKAGSRSGASTSPPSLSVAG